MSSLTIFLAQRDERFSFLAFAVCQGRLLEFLAYLRVSNGERVIGE